MEPKITIFETGIEDGIMSKNKKFYPEGTTSEERRKIFLQTRIDAMNKIGLNGRKMFIAHQKTERNGLKYPDGKYIVLNDSHMKKDDFWYEDLQADILILSEKYKNIVVGHQMADCPILIVEDMKNGVTAVSHCGASYIDRYLPKQTIEALQKEFNSNVEDLSIYIGSHSYTYEYDRYPLWAKSDDVWEGNIIEKDGIFHIDMKGAIVKQLESMGVTNIEVSPVDTVTDDRYYSHCAAVKGNKEKFGENFVGFFYAD